MQHDQPELGLQDLDLTTASGSEENKSDKLSGLLREGLETLLMAAIIWAGVNVATARFRVEGASMEPNLHTGNFVIVSRVAYWKVMGEPRRGDVVVFQPPTNPQEDYIKRVIGLPGDTVEIREGRVYVNGGLLEEPYISVPTNRSGIWRVAEGEYFVLGDNRNDSDDSRNFGPLDADSIVGKAWVVYWPVRDWGLVPHQSYVTVPDGAADTAQVPELAPTVTATVPGTEDTAGGLGSPAPAPQEPTTQQTVPSSPDWMGSTVVIASTEGEGLAIRQGPSLSQAALFVAEDGEIYVVQGGPREQDGYIWWYVVDPNNSEKAGWAVQDYMERILSGSVVQAAA